MTALGAADPSAAISTYLGGSDMTALGDIPLTDDIEDYAGAAAPSVVSPAIAGYVGWYDFTDPDQVTLAANGIYIASVNDQGSGANDATAVGDIVYGCAGDLFGGRRAAIFDTGASAWLTSACPTLGDVSSTAIFAGWINGLASYRTLLAGQTNGGLQWLDDGSGLLTMFQSTVGMQASKGNGAVTSKTPFVAAYRETSSACTQYLKLAGASVTQETDANSNSATAGQLYIGRSPGTTHGFVGGILQVILYDTTLSDADTLSAIDALATGLGI